MTGDRSLFVPTPSAGDSSNRIANTQFVASAITTGLATALSTVTDFISGIIRSPTNQDYRIVEKLPIAITVTEFSAKTASGSITATLKVGAAGITNGVLGVTSSQTSSIPSGANTAASGAALVITGSGASAPADMSFTVKFTRSIP